jgi:hypothetical protein
MPVMVYFVSGDVEESKVVDADIVNPLSDTERKVVEGACIEARARAGNCLLEVDQPCDVLYCIGDAQTTR